MLSRRPAPRAVRPVAGARFSLRAGIASTGALLVLLAALCAGCGQKGDLYLPDESPEAQAGR